MSGNLKLLPHKSWNVWGRENREKVLRDERLHGEKVEADAEREKKLMQEQNRSVLLVDKNSKNEVAPFRLFEDIEKIAQKSEGNEDYIKEKERLEKIKAKREGTAPWAVGEGSLEAKGLKPWYEKNNPLSYASAADFQVVKEKRKLELDPMRDYLSKYDQQDDEISDDSEDEGVKDQLALENSVEQSLNKKKSKKERKEDKRKRSESEDENRKEKHNKKKKKRSHEKEIHKNSKSKSSKESKIYQEMREKRLEREAKERKKAARLLSHVDVYGVNSSSSRSGENGFSQQFHPHLSNKRFSH